MTDIEMRLRTLEDREALKAVLLQYYYAVDSMTDYDRLVDCFTEDATFDVEDLGLAVYRGHDAIRAFFEGVFSSTLHHCHHISNFDITRLEENEASARGYVFAKAQGRDGSNIVVHCSYAIEYVRTSAGWKIAVFDEDFLIPMADEVRKLHS